MGTLHRASVADIKSNLISKANGHLIVAMRVYPRFLPKVLIHEYKKSLSPDSALFARYREYKKKSGDQNQAFELAGYEENFHLSDQGLQDLERVSELARSEDVFLICQCAANERCHVDLILLLAERRFQAKRAAVPFEYARFRNRL